tara:strand:- start:151 stop:1011 length:861 start_codon:yes stop_codon:yes gene_type:complete
VNKLITILVTGAKGQLGSELQEIASRYENIHFIFATKSLLDISNTTALNDFFKNQTIDFCINTAAYTAVDHAEKDSETAFLINSTAVGNLVKACNIHNAKLIQISTDFVFDGKNDVPYKETDPTNALSVYGESKLKGEGFALKQNHMVIRTSWLYSCSYGNNFLKTMIRLGTERDELNIIDDQKGTPTNAKDLALVIMNTIVNNDKTKITGLYHFSNSGVASWYDFAKEIFSLANISCIVNPIPTTEYPTPAERPKYSVMNKSKIVNDFSIKLVDWKESLSNCFSK